MTDHDAADAANDRHAERMADLPEQADPRDTDPAIAAEWDEWLVTSTLSHLRSLYDGVPPGGTVTVESVNLKRLSGDAEASTEQEAWWS